ncbi:MAG: hypothetical protein LUQ11_02195 [Methylococcaceae bacterium]|nr:hypothetical protein [Methylococcaceae bacterium]
MSNRKIAVLVGMLLLPVSEVFSAPNEASQPNSYSQAEGGSESLTFTTLKQGEGSEIRHGDTSVIGAEAIITDPTTWKGFWTAHAEDLKSPTELPSVDFTSEMVIVSSMGDILGVTLEHDPDTLHVLIGDHDASVASSDTSRSIHIIKLKKISLQSVAFEHQRLFLDPLSEVETRKPAEFNATVEALSQYVIKHADGSLAVEAPASVERTVDQESYAAILGALDEFNQVTTGNSARMASEAMGMNAKGAGMASEAMGMSAKGAGMAAARIPLPRIPWSKIIALVKRLGKWVWYKSHLCVGGVISHWANITLGSPNPNDWVWEAAWECVRAMR